MRTWVHTYPWHKRLSQGANPLGSYIKAIELAKWDLESCKARAKLYETRTEWRKSCASYHAAQKMGWLDYCCVHMGKRAPRKATTLKWTREVCQSDALRFNTRTEWQRGSSGYQAARRKGWLEECCKHMSHVSWCRDSCILDAKQYTDRTTWKSNSAGAYDAAQKNGWLDICTLHMPSRRVEWTLEACRTDALQFSTRSEWQKGSPAGYSAAYKNEWLDICCKHMKSIKWHFEACVIDAASFETRKEWRTGSPSAYRVAQRKGWLSSCKTRNELNAN